MLVTSHPGIKKIDHSSNIPLLCSSAALISLSSSNAKLWSQTTAFQTKHWSGNRSHFLQMQYICSQRRTEGVTSLDVLEHFQSLCQRGKNNLTSYTYPITGLYIKAIY